MPVRSGISFEESGNRLTTGLRFLWIIPALIIGALLGIAAIFVVVISWFAIVITGKQPQGMWEFVLKVVRYTLQLQAYGLLMTDVYPKFGDDAMAAAAPTSPQPPPASFVPPPPA